SLGSLLYLVTSETQLLVEMLDDLGFRHPFGEPFVTQVVKAESRCLFAGEESRDRAAASERRGQRTAELALDVAPMHRVREPPARIRRRRPHHRCVSGASADDGLAQDLTTFAAADRECVRDCQFS